MEKDDIETMERISSKYKMRYDNMTVNFGDKIQGTNVFVPINITNLLKDLDMFKESLIDVKDFEFHSAVSILNLYAHYKHYFMINDANHVVIIGYVKDNYTYDKYKDIIDQVVDYCGFFPNIYTVPKILLDNRFYIHIVSAIMMYMKSVFPTTNHSSIFVVSNFSMDRQMMCLFPTYAAYTMLKGYAGQPIILDKLKYMSTIMKKEMFYTGSTNKVYLEYLNMFIGRYFGTNANINKNSASDIKIQYVHSKTTEKLEVMNKFFNSTFNKESIESISSQAYKYFTSIGEFANQESATHFLLFEKVYDFRFQNLGELNTIIIPLLNSWRTKLKDYEMQKDAEKYKKLISHQMFTNWLTQG